MAKPLPEDPFIRSLVIQAQRAQFSRRNMLKGAGIGAGALALAACTPGGSDAPKPAKDKSDTDKIVRWDNWALYLDVDDSGHYPTLEAFEKQTGIKATYTEAVDDNNTYYGKVKDQLKLGQDIGCDTVCLTDWMVDRWIRFGYTQEFDYSQIPNSKNLVPELKNVQFDPGRKHSLPWQGGFAGIAWNKDQLPGGLTSVSDLWDPSLKGRVGVLSEMRDTMGCIMQDLGTQIDGKWGDDEFTAAIDVLQKQVSDGQIRNIKGNSYKEDLQNGDTLAAIVWSGDITQLNFEAGDHWAFSLPSKGGTLWNDNFLIPIGSAHKKNAEMLINYYYDPEVAAQVAAYVNYIPPVVGTKDAMMALDPDLANDQLIFPSDATLANAHVFRSLSSAEDQKYNAQFQAILLGA
ncbi:MAG: spermidine/putrescine ABC transporter substrate-binding protein [Cryobacterium sp.]|nr:spermidine/putrescine ABC transporter substrate-binding protein [Micrococcales bacterium]MBX3079318.1 spermidine/putrescine ABC transporter substrate-binding protein [Cryobacterium sp.]